MHQVNRSGNEFISQHVAPLFRTDNELVSTISQ